MIEKKEFSESLLVHFRRVEDLRQKALEYTSLSLNRRQLSDLELLLNRAFYPLTGFMNVGDYNGVVEEMRLLDGTVWPMPICLDVGEKIASNVEKGQVLALTDP